MISMFIAYGASNSTLKYKGKNLTIFIVFKSAMARLNKKCSRANEKERNNTERKNCMETFSYYIRSGAKGDLRCYESTTARGESPKSENTG